MADDDDIDQALLVVEVIAARMRLATGRAKQLLEGAKGGLCALSVAQFNAYCAALRALDTLEETLK